MSTRRDLTPTSHAILGLLALRPWTTYELAQQMKRALGQFWPRAESKLYEEPKKLVARGLAEARSETVGKRPRTVYSITPAGRRALEEWIPQPGAGPVIEFEDLIKVFFAEHGAKDDLLAVIERVRAWREEQATLSVEICRGYLEGRGPFPERLPWLLLAGQFLAEFDEAMGRWADWADEVVSAWPEDLSQAEPEWPALEHMAARSEAVLREAAERRRASV